MFSADPACAPASLTFVACLLCSRVEGWLFLVLLLLVGLLLVVADLACACSCASALWTLACLAFVLLCQPSVRFLFSGAH